MKRALLTAFASIAFLAVCAQTGNSDSNITGGQVVGLGLKDYVNIVDKVKGHVFLSKGESRELANIVGNTDQLPNEANRNDLTWEAYNSGIVEIDTENGTITGKKFGQTIVEVKDPKGDNYYVAILVCPTITIKSPEGAIYKHQKMYGSRARIQLTQSKDWLVNCVMQADVDDEGNIKEDPRDVTEFVSPDGTFETEFPVKNDMILTVSMEENNPVFSDNDNEDAHLGVSGLSLKVNSLKGIVEFSNEEGVYDLEILRKYTLSISPIMYPEKELFGKPLPENNTVSFGAGNQGVFVLCFKDGNGNVVGGKFKVIIQREFAISPETSDVADNTVE